MEEVQPSTNLKVCDLIPSPYSLHEELSLGKILKLKLRSMALSFRVLFFRLTLAILIRADLSPVNLVQIAVTQ